MLVRGKLFRHGLLTVLAIPALAVFIGLGSNPTANGALPADLSALIAAGVAGVLALLHLGFALYNPNGNRRANLRQAEREIAEYRLEMVQPGLVTESLKVPANVTLVHGLAMLGLLLAAPAFLTAVFLRIGHGWPNNAELRPALIAPGDEVLVDMPARHVHSVGSAWQGDVAVKVLNAAEVGGLGTLQATTQSVPWPDTPKSKRSEVDTPIRPFATLRVPNDPELGGKTLRVHVHLNITYPSRNSGKGYSTERTTVSRDLTIQVTPPEGRQTYWLAWRIGAGGGFFSCVLGGLVLTWLAYRLGKKALPSIVVPMRAKGDGVVR